MGTEKVLQPRQEIASEYRCPNGFVITKAGPDHSLVPKFPEMYL